MRHGGHGGQLLAHDERAAGEGRQDLAHDDVADVGARVAEVDEQRGGERRDGHGAQREPLEAARDADEDADEGRPEAGPEAVDVEDVARVADVEVVDDLQVGREVEVPAAVGGARGG